VSTTGESTNGTAHLNVPSPAHALEANVTDSPKRLIDQPSNTMLDTKPVVASSIAQTAVSISYLSTFKCRATSSVK